MAETLHEMAVRMVGDRCSNGCDKCSAGKLRSTNGVCLVCRIAKVDNCEEQIEGVRTWAAEHPEPMYPSWREAWQSLFPYAEELCPGKLFGEDCPEGILCSECIERPMSKKVAEKLGIELITTAKAVPEHDGCEGCRWMDKQEDEEPCKNCWGVMGGSAPDLWEEGKYE